MMHQADQDIQNHNLVKIVDLLREFAFSRIARAQRRLLGQFGTPEPVARLMASMFHMRDPDVRLLDAGAGVGSLTAAFVDEACRRSPSPRSIHVTAVEVETSFLATLEEALQACRAHCLDHCVKFTYEIINHDFIQYMIHAKTDRDSSLQHGTFNCAIQNPPYRKLRSNSEHRKLLRSTGIEVANLYAAFVALTVRLLDPRGELVTIIPRSFCNGLYFQSFRVDLLKRTSLRRIHIFDSRTKAFNNDGVRQENVIVHAVVGAPPPSTIQLTSSFGGPEDDAASTYVAYNSVVPPKNHRSFIHLITDSNKEAVADQMRQFRYTLEEVGVNVSTGRVVDFRARTFLRQMPDTDDAPLLYPLHLRQGVIDWPQEESKKPNAIAIQPESKGLLVPPGVYVLVKRVSSKEQRRRIEASLFVSNKVKPDSPVGFENHLNYFHEDGSGLDHDLALGLCVYLNSTLVDLYFRLFSGHTQVNATDIRSLPFPAREALIVLGTRARSSSRNQAEIDRLFEEEFSLRRRRVYFR